MKSGHYIAVFVIFIAIIAGAIIYNAQKINEIEDDVTQVQDNYSAMQQKQEKIDVLNDIDFESDALDEEMMDDVSDFDEIDGLIEETSISF